MPHRPTSPIPEKLQASMAVTVALLCLLGAACGGDDNPNRNQILPIVATPSLPTVTDDPAVYLQQSAADTSATDDLVILDVMLRMGAPVAFDGFTLEFLFTPGILQVGQIDASASPLGDCNAAVDCVVTANAADANLTGDLVIGVGVTLGGTPVTPSPSPPDTMLLSIGFVAASTGTSEIKFVTGAGRGDCEILVFPDEVVPSVPCVDTAGMVTASITGSR